MTFRQFARWLSLAVGQSPHPLPRPSRRRSTRSRFGTNWVAEAEHGGFYQAVADGTYRNYGLDVTIVPGGPQLNNRLLLPVGRIDFS